MHTRVCIRTHDQFLFFVFFACMCMHKGPHLNQRLERSGHDFCNLVVLQLCEYYRCACKKVISCDNSHLRRSNMSFCCECVCVCVRTGLPISCNRGHQRSSMSESVYVCMCVCVCRRKPISYNHGHLRNVLWHAVYVGV